MMIHFTILNPRSISRLLLVFVGLLVFLGCGLVKTTVEKKLKANLYQLLEPAQEYRVNISSSSSLDLLKGKVSQVTIYGKQLHLPHAPAVEEFFIELHQIHYDRKSKSLKQIKQGKFKLVIYDQDLNEYLQEEKSLRSKDATDEFNIRDLTILFRQEEMVLLAYLFYRPRGGIQLALEVPLNLSGKLQIREKTKIDFIPQSFSIASLTVPEYITAQLIDEINPIIDLQFLPFSILIEELKLKKNSLILKGKVSSFTTNKPD